MNILRCVVFASAVCFLSGGKVFSQGLMSSKPSSSPPPSVSAMTVIHKMSCEDCQKSFLKREKKLGVVRSLLNASGIDLASPIPPQRLEGLSSRQEGKRVDHELEALKKVYRRQYSFFDRQKLPSQGGRYKSIMDEMRMLLDQLDQKELSYLVKYQKALHCHELFASLERMLMKDNSLEEVGAESPLSPGGMGYHLDVTTSPSGDVEQTPRKKVRKPRPEEVDDMPFMAVSSSTAVKHGLDKLLDIEK